MSFKNEQSSAIFRIPESDTPIFISWNDLSSFVSPYNQSLFWFTLSIAHSLGHLFLAVISNIKYRDVTINVRGH